MKIKHMRMRKAMMIFVMVTALTSLMFQNGCNKADFSIEGQWEVSVTIGTSGTFFVGFVGSKELGNTIYNNQQAGEYEVSGSDVEFVLRLDVVLPGGIQELFIYHFTGTFQDDTHMSGSVLAYLLDVPGSEETGSWTAVKID